jgi:hypothetical protein
MSNGPTGALLVVVVGCNYKWGDANSAIGVPDTRALEQYHLARCLGRWSSPKLFGVCTGE